MIYDTDGKIILFGAGVYAKKYKALLEYLHMDFDYFTDNDSSKWGTVLYGKPVISPNELLLLSECRIIISSTHEIAIREQLSNMGLTQCIIGLDDLYRLCEQEMNVEINQKIKQSKTRTVLIDMYEGIGWGGSEIWAANLALNLHNSGEKVVLIGGTEQPHLEPQYENLVQRMPEQETIKHMVDFMESNLPCVFVNNFAGCGFMAAIILKKKYPKAVKIVSVIHSDNKSLFDAHMMLQKYIDKIFCVSQLIGVHMKALYAYESQKYFFKEQPVSVDLQWNRKWNGKIPLVIGYAGRLVKQAKRADLLTDFIHYLEMEKIDYLFQIAGEGECLEKLEKFIQEKNLTAKVQLFGRLPKSEMASFWRRQDVFVNISEYEGTSLSMLEAMSYGCVPVVTDVSGAREFIEEGKNGYICDVGDIEGIAKCVAELAKNKEKLINYGEKCRRIIQERCNPQEYIKYWQENMLR